nr:MAG TPA: hypothetical protein [Bacteriophage sp.]
MILKTILDFRPKINLRYLLNLTFDNTDSPNYNLCSIYKVIK